MILTRGWSTFLVLAGLFNWAVWPRFTVAIWQDQRAWQGAIGSSTATSFLWVHAVLIGTALAIGTVVAVVGVRGLLALRNSTTVARTR
ncbi:SCO4848 family membrane protein [Nakamurella sp. GG22]